jgi:hypothetical protein
MLPTSPAKKSSLFSDIKRVQNKTRQAHGNQQRQTRLIYWQKEKLTMAVNAYNDGYTINTVHKIKGINPAYQQYEYNW